MPFDGAGTFTPPAADFPAVTGSTISSTKFNSVINDIATGLSNAVTRNGQSAWTANLPAGGFKITGLGAGSAATDSARIGDIQDAAVTYAGTAGGTANALTLTLVPGITAYAVGQRFLFKSSTSPNTSTVTVAINGLSAKAIQLNGFALAAADIEASKYYEIFYDGTQFQLLKVATGLFSTGDVKLTFKTQAEAGWVLMNDTTIGDATSGATGRAAADTEALFTLLWNNTANADCAVSGGRGASAAADYAAHKTIALPKALGRALACYGTGSGLTARALAAALGSENAVNVSHSHTGTTSSDGSHQHQYVDCTTGPTGAGGSTGAGTRDTNAQTGAAGAHTHTFTTSTDGVSGTGANLQPTLFLNVAIKL